MWTLAHSQDLIRQVPPIFLVRDTASDWEVTTVIVPFGAMCSNERLLVLLPQLHTDVDHLLLSLIRCYTGRTVENLVRHNRI